MAPKLGVFEAIVLTPSNAPTTPDELIARHYKVLSYHRTGANIAACDSHVKFFSKDTDKKVMQHFITRAGINEVDGVIEY